MKIKKVLSTMIVFALILAMLRVSAAAEGKVETRANVTEKTSVTYQENVSAWTGEHGTYASFPVSITITSNITFNYATGEIKSYSTPMITMTCNEPGRSVSVIASTPICRISNDKYSLEVTVTPSADIKYLWGSLEMVHLYDQRDYTFSTCTKQLKPQ